MTSVDAFDVRGATMSLTATDYDVRGIVASVDPSAVVYDVRQLDSTYAAAPSPLPFDMSSLQLNDNAAPSPLPVDLTSLQINDSPAPSPLPFDLSTLRIDESSLHPPDDVLIEIIEAIDKADYDTLERYARNGYNFNAHSTKKSELGVAPLNRIVAEHPRRTDGRFNLEAAVQLIRWLIAHGADPETCDAYFGHRMFWVLEFHYVAARDELSRCCDPYAHERHDNYYKLWGHCKSSWHMIKMGM